MPALYFAALQQGWFSEQVEGLEDEFIAQGWVRLSWCDQADLVDGHWMDGGRDTNHPARPTASLFLTRLLAQLPATTQSLLLVGDSTLSQHFGEWRRGRNIWYDWADRERFLQESGAPPGTAMWSVPGVGCDGIVEQIQNARQWASAPFDAVLVVGGWNDWQGVPTELVGLVTQAAMR